MKVKPGKFCQIWQYDVLGQRQGDPYQFLWTIQGPLMGSGCIIRFVFTIRHMADYTDRLGFSLFAVNLVKTGVTDVTGRQ